MIDDSYYTDSIIHPDCIHYRLRVDKSIVGYMQIRPGLKIFYSKDSFWWQSNEIKYIQKDRSTEFFDINRQMIFEYDLVRIKKENSQDYTKNGLIQWDTKKQKLVINLIEENRIQSLFVKSNHPPFLDNLRVTGQLFY